MNDKAKSNGQTKSQIEPRTPRTWGMTSADFYTALQDKPCAITTLDAKAYRGVLVGCDQYDLMLKQSAGIVLITKHAIKLVTADTNGTNGTTN